LKSEDHKPIHVHGKYQGTESKAEIIFEDGKFLKICISSVKGKKPLTGPNLKKFKKLVEVYKEDITKKWIEFFIYNKPIHSEVITKKL
jgi:hypothetical protein